jgi:hypothetical protein
MKGRRSGRLFRLYARILVLKVCMTMPELRSPMPKSEVLRPLIWLVGFSTTGATGTSFSAAGIPTWMIVLAVLAFASLIIAYWYLLIWHPDRLQSEDYQKHLLGDNRIASLGAPIAANTVPQGVLSKPGKKK